MRQSVATSRPSRLALIGTLIGVTAALWLSRLLTGMLYGVTPTDLVTYANIALLMLAVAGLAAWIPARRAVRRDPLASLRND